MAKSKKKKKKRNGFLRFFLKLQIFLILLVVAGLLYYYGGGYAKKVSELRREAIDYVKNADTKTFMQDQTSIAYDVNGNTLSVLKGEHDRYYLTSAEIPQYAKDAAVSTEDKKFYRHHGVDYKAIMRAVYAMVRNGKVTQGASTITQQLARNVFLNQDKTWERKIEEIYISVELEKRFSKDQILEFYLNNINFGNGYYGLEAAAHGYFNKNASELTVSEIAFLIGIPNRPSYFDPLVHMDHAMERRNLVLDNLLSDKKISRETYLAAFTEPVTLNRPEGVYNNYAETYLINCTTRILMQQNGFEFRTEFSDEADEAAYKDQFEQAYGEANQSIFTGGYRIYTSLNLDAQNKLQQELDEELAVSSEKTEEGTYALQGASVLIDNSTGMVRAIVGGRTQNITGYTLNRAYQSYRQPGSSIKPLVVYTPALENGYTPDTIVEDAPIEGGPKNADSAYLGKMTLQRAVALSRNTVAWNLFLELGPVKGMDYLKKMNFAHISEKDIVPAASIGGLHEGVSPLEMAKAYATIENDGGYRNPSCIAKITDAEGNSIYETDQTALVVYQESASRTMTQILETVLTQGTGKGYALSNMPSAGKTGTTNEDKDSWFVGYTPYYTMSVWVGYDRPRTMTGTGFTVKPLKIWHDYMQEIHTGLEARPFQAPKEQIVAEQEAQEAAEKAAEEQVEQEKKAAEEAANAEALRKAEEEAQKKKDAESERNEEEQVEENEEEHKEENENL